MAQRGLRPWSAMVQVRGKHSAEGAHARHEARRKALANTFSRAVIAHVEHPLAAFRTAEKEKAKGEKSVGSKSRRIRRRARNARRNVVVTLKERPTRTPTQLARTAIRANMKRGDARRMCRRLGVTWKSVKHKIKEARHS